MLNGRGSMALALGVGAGLMYLLDPDRGARRRAGVRDRIVSGSNRLAEAAGAAGRDISNRLSGAMARWREAAGDWTAGDGTLTARARAKLGRVVSHPHAIEIETSGGVVTLRGPILDAEVPALLSAIGGIHGVTHVVNQLEVHENALGVPALQGGRRPASGFDVLPANWSPATRVAAGAACWRARRPTRTCAGWQACGALTATRPAAASPPTAPPTTRRRRCEPASPSRPTKPMKAKGWNHAQTRS
jgi:hypothetical protein